MFRPAGDLSKAALAILEAAPRYAEGAGIRMPVASAADLRVALQLVALKLAGATRPAASNSRKRARNPATRRPRTTRR